MAEDSSEGKPGRGRAPSEALSPENKASWRVPREGTFARDVFEMMCIGYSEAEIVMKTGATRDFVHVTMHDIADGGERHRRTQKAYIERQKEREK